MAERGTRKKARGKQVHDPRVLRAIAHPVRNRILGEVTAAGHIRAADVAELLGIKPSSVNTRVSRGTLVPKLKDPTLGNLFDPADLEPELQTEILRG